MHVDRILLQLKVSGFSVIEHVIPEEDVERVRDSIQRTVVRLGAQSSFAPPGASVIAGLINHDQSFVSFLVEPRLTAVITALLGDHYRVSFTTALVNYPGNERGQWHADWPFIQSLGARFPAPYPDLVMHLTAIFMLTPFSTRTGATYVFPGSHRVEFNPTDDRTVDRFEPLDGEVQATGAAGSVLLLDSRCWHAAASNQSAEPRVALAARFAPWWLNLEVLRPNSFLRRRMVDEAGKPDGPVPPIPWGVYRSLPEDVKPLFHHWIERAEAEVG